MNTRTLIVAALAGTLATAPVHAGHGHGHPDGGTFVDRAKVTSVEAIHRTERVPVEREECREQPVWHRERSVGPGAGLIAGSIIGGVIGHQIGRGDGNKAATVAGTLLGAAIGHDMAGSKPARAYRTSERRCEVFHDYVERDRVVGYQVSYRYHGQTFTRRMDHDPGPWVDVEVEVRPAY